jgi:hypothetical protein
MATTPSFTSFTSFWVGLLSLRFSGHGGRKEKQALKKEVRSKKVKKNEGTVLIPNHSTEAIMSLAIEVNCVIEVLLKDGWHEVADRSFTIDAYEFVHRDPGARLSDGDLLVGGGTVDGVSSTGAAWKEPGGYWVACPFPAIVSVKLNAVNDEQTASEASAE